MPEPEPRPGVTVHRSPLEPGLADAAAAALATAFEHDPVTVGAAAGLRARHLLMRVPVDAAAVHGGLLVLPRPDPSGRAGHRVVGAAAWVPGGARGGGVGTVIGSGSWRLLPLLGPRTLMRVVREAVATDGLVSGYLRPGDAYLWVVGVRPEAQGAGLGGRLVRAVLADAAAAGSARLVLVTHRTGNVALYRALGFELLDDTARSRGRLLHVMARETRAGS